MLFALARERAQAAATRCSPACRSAIPKAAQCCMWRCAGGRARFEVDGEDVCRPWRRYASASASVRHSGARGELARLYRRSGHDVVNIGIGGSGPGPAMACQALAAYGHARLTMHFVSNVDGDQLAQVLARVEPRTDPARDRLEDLHHHRDHDQRGQRPRLVPRRRGGREGHRAPLRGGVECCQGGQFRDDAANMFGFWDWVGGRYSMGRRWDCRSRCGRARELETMLDGATGWTVISPRAPLEANMPAISPCSGVVPRLLPCHQRVHRAVFAGAGAHAGPTLQALGWRVTGIGDPRRPAGRDVDLPGGVGQPAPTASMPSSSCCTRAPTRSRSTSSPRQAAHTPGHHRLLLANCIAQKALMVGKTADEVRAELTAAGMSGAALEALVPHRVFQGNRPSNTILMPALSPPQPGAR